MRKNETKLAKEIRLLGFTQKEAAKILKVREMTISKWVNGNAVISPAMVKRLKEIGVPMAAIRNPSEKA